MQAVLNAPMFEVRFRHVATRALSIVRSNKGANFPLISSGCDRRSCSRRCSPASRPVSRTARPRSSCRIILSSPRRFASAWKNRPTPRGWNRCCAESSNQYVVTVDAIAPSVFAHRLLAWDYSFLDDGERANRRSRTVQMNRGMAEDVLPLGTFGTALARGHRPRHRRDCRDRAGAARAHRRRAMRNHPRAWRPHAERDRGKGSRRRRRDAPIAGSRGPRGSDTVRLQSHLNYSSPVKTRRFTRARILKPQLGTKRRPAKRRARRSSVARSRPMDP